MVSEWLRMRLDKDSQPTLLSTAVSHLECHLCSFGDSDYKTRQEGEAHLDTIWGGVKNCDDFLDACITFGSVYRDQGRLKDAEMMHSRALAGYEKALGPDHTLTLVTVDNLGLLYYVQGRLKDAEMYDRVQAASIEKA